jgi:hypothetical protein
MPRDRFLSRQLVVACVLALDDADRRRRHKEKRQALAWKPSGLALLLRLKRPAADVGGGHIMIRHMLQMYLSNVSYVLEVRCKRFMWMLQT